MDQQPLCKAGRNRSPWTHWPVSSAKSVSPRTSEKLCLRNRMERSEEVPVVKNLYKIQVWVLAPMSGSLQLPLTPTLGDPMPSGLHKRTHITPHSCADTQAFKIHII